MQITPSFCVVVQAAAVAQCDVLLGPHGAGLAHLAFMPANESRLTLLTKWLWMIATRERSALVITETSS